MSEQDAQSLSDHLLRTLAAVPVSSEILDFGCGGGHHTEALLRLGFPVHACDPRPGAVDQTRERVQELIGEESAETSVQVTPLGTVEYPEATFDWVVADRAEIYVSNQADLQSLFDESRRLLKPGGWLYITLPAPPQDMGENEGQEEGFSEETIEEYRNEAELVVASEASRVEEGQTPRIRAIYRCVDPHTPT